MQLNQNHCPVIDISELIRDIDIFAASSYHHILFFNEYRKNLRAAESRNSVYHCLKY